MQNSVLSGTFNQKAVNKAEILWILYVVNQNLSLNSTNDIKLVMQEMFPDSQIAKHIKLAKTKTKYVIDYGLGPYLKKLLCELIEFTYKWNGYFI